MRLLAALDAYLESLYPPGSNHILDVDTLCAPDIRFFVARRGGEAVGCGALRIDPAGYGEVIVLRHLEGLPFAEVAERMRRTQDSVKKLWVRAIAKLREALREGEE